MKASVRLAINHLENLNVSGVEEGYPLMIKIKWIGSQRKTRYLGNNAKENRTSVKHVQADGVVRWSQEFDHTVKLQRIKPVGYKSWFLHLKVGVSLIIFVMF